MEPVPAILKKVVACPPTLTETGLSVPTEKEGGIVGSAITPLAACPIELLLFSPQVYNIFGSAGNAPGVITATPG